MSVLIALRSFSICIGFGLPSAASDSLPNDFNYGKRMLGFMIVYSVVRNTKMSALSRDLAFT